MGIRRKSREVALQALYQSELCGISEPDLATICQNFKVAKKAIPYATELVKGIVENSAEINAILKKYSKNWRIDRMSVIDRNLIRIGTYELVLNDSVPATVAINEAIEIAKKFGNDESPSFVNGILDAIRDGEK